MRETATKVLHGHNPSTIHISRKSLTLQLVKQKNIKPTIVPTEYVTCKYNLCLWIDIRSTTYSFHSLSNTAAPIANTMKEQNKTKQNKIKPHRRLISIFTED